MTTEAQRSHGLTFLFTDQDTLPDRYLHGHAFVDADYIADTPGATAYERATGRQVPPNEDGCYFTLTATSDGHRMGVDYAGAKKLFYYRHGTAWCVSNSLALIAEHLRTRGLPVTVNFGQLAALKSLSSFAAQMATPATILNEVRLLPTRATIAVTARGLETHAPPAEQPSTYPDALRAHVSHWLARMRTLAADPDTRILSDLTGGRDSRAVFALIKAATDHEHATRGQVTLRPSTNPRAAADLAAATALAAAYDWTVNEPLTDPRPLSRLGDDERYTACRYLCLGIYSPVYFPDRRPDARHIELHGGGGECHRPFYPGDGITDLLQRLKDIEPSYLGNVWRRDVIRYEDDLDRLWPGTPHLISHYREFRNRLHVGLLPQYRAVVSPLNSRFMAPMSQHPEKVESDQIGLDIMENLVPGIMHHGYDEGSKIPTDANVAAVTRLADVDSVSAGRVYAGPAAPAADGARTRSGHFQMMAADLDAALASEGVRDFLGAELVDTARTAMASAVEAGRFGHARDAKAITLALSTALAFDAAQIS